MIKHIDVLKLKTANKLQRHIYISSTTNRMIQRPNPDRRQLEPVKEALLDFVIGKGPLPKFIDFSPPTGGAPQPLVPNTNTAQTKKRKFEGGASAAGSKKPKEVPLEPVPTTLKTTILVEKKKLTEKEIKTVKLNLSLAQDGGDFNISHIRYQLGGRFITTVATVAECRDFRTWLEVNYILPGVAQHTLVPPEYPMMPFKLLTEPTEEPTCSGRRSSGGTASLAASP